MDLCLLFSDLRLLGGRAGNGDSILYVLLVECPCIATDIRRLPKHIVTSVKHMYKLNSLNTDVLSAAKRDLVFPL